MGRSGYVEWDDCDEETILAMGRSRGRLLSAARGRRGKAFLQRLAAALDGMPVKELVYIPSSDSANIWEEDPPVPGCDRLGLPDGSVCVLGALARAEGHDPAAIDATDYDGLSKTFDVAPALVRHLEWENDEAWPKTLAPAERWRRLRKEVDRLLGLQRPQPTKADGGD